MIFRGHEIVEASSELIDVVIEDRQPRGLFIYLDKGGDRGDRYVGVDNRGGDAWTEDFATMRECLAYLVDEE